MSQGEDDLRDLFGRAEPATDLLLSRQPRNDIGNARRLIRRFGRDLIYVKDLGWHIWAGTHWDQDHGEREAQQRAHQVARLILDEARAAEMDGPRKDESGAEIETPKEFLDRVKKLASWSNASGNMRHIRGMLEAAEPDLARDRRDLDADPLLFNLRNGTLVLKPDGTVDLRQHDRKDLLTRMAPVDFDPKAACPKFVEWLRFILPDPQDLEEDGEHRAEGEIRGLLKRFFGYCLTGSTALQVAPLFCGTGANGKSTLVNVLRGLFGPYAQTLPVETLLENDRKGGADASPDIARLPSTRLALASEPEKKSRLSTAKLKQFTGGEPIVARGLYADFFEFQPAFKMILSFNDRPSVPAQDDGTWRRLLLIMFEQKIPKEQRKERFELELLTEASGILNWLVEGYADWRREGLRVPEGVRAATEDYRNDNDPLGQFLKECIKPVAEMVPPKPGQPPQERAASLYAAYELWCEDAAADPVTKRVFGLRLRDKGFAKSHSNGSVYLNLQLLDEWYAKAGELLQRRADRARGAQGRGRHTGDADDSAARAGVSAAEMHSTDGGAA